MKSTKALSYMSRIREKANKLIVDELEKNGVTGIVPSHGDILAFLFYNEKSSMNDLAKTIHRTKPTVTVLVGKLAELGYVTREKSAEDSRVTYISLTQKGRSLKPIFEAVSQTLNHRLYDCLSEEELETLDSLLEKINKSF